MPPGAGAAEGTYVRYDADAMLGILALEAQRAGAVVIGEDLGTVQPAVTRALRGRNMLGSTVLWFTRDERRRSSEPKKWPRNALASISTHDLPTAHGFLTRRARRGAGAARVSWPPARPPSGSGRRPTGRPCSRCCAPPACSVPVRTIDAIVTAMHAALAASPARLITASLYDVLGETRQPNLPGTTDQYPNWRLPLPLPREEIQDHPGVRATARLLAAARPRRRRD